MPKPITIQIQLQPDLELSPEYLKRCKTAMVDAVLKIEALGYVRYDMFVGEKAYTETL